MKSGRKVRETRLRLEGFVEKVGLCFEFGMEERWSDGMMKVMMKMMNRCLGARRHAQEGVIAPPPLWKCCKVFCALVVTTKHAQQTDYLCIIFTTCRLLGASPPDPLLGTHPWTTPLGYLCPETPNFPTPGKNHAGTHELVWVRRDKSDSDWWSTGWRWRSSFREI